MTSFVKGCDVLRFSTFAGANKAAQRLARHEANGYTYVTKAQGAAYVIAVYDAQGNYMGDW